MKNSSGLLLLLLLGTCSARTYQNVALRGRATQSKQFNHQLADANNAIDGNRESDYYTGSCAFSEKQTNPWWRVDLRDCCPERLNGADIHISNSLQDKGAGNPYYHSIYHIPAGRSLTITFTRLVEGRYVTVVLPGIDKYLTLCEVEVYGYRVPTDGSRANNWNQASCTCTNADFAPWWRLDLGKTHKVFSVNITNRRDGVPQRINCNGMDGRYVNIVIPRRSEHLILCEVEVYGSRLD
ncbi:tumor necrosis factor receptor superfamily member 6B [Sarotherodon galilaeus]